MNEEGHLAISIEDSDTLLHRTDPNPPPYTLPKRLSLAHIRHSQNDTSESVRQVLDNEERRLQYLDILQELNAYYTRQNQLHNGVDQFFFGQDNLEDKSKLTYVFKSCLLDQFKGVFLVFWLAVFIILGVISVVLTDLPRGILALWALFGLYVCIAAIIRLKAYKESLRISRLEEQFRTLRREMTQETILEQHRFKLPEDHFFEIHYTKQHTYPVITLLPPPPVYS